MRGKMRQGMGQRGKETNLGKLFEKRDIRILFWLCWTVYCISYLGRLNYSSAMMLMISEHLLTSSQAGFISMIYFFAYGIGQLINGILGDRVDPKRMIFVGLFGSGIANIVMGVCAQFAAMALIWGANGYFQAMIWAPIIRIFAEMLDEKNKVDCCVNIVTSQLIGTLLSYLLSAAVLAVLPWPGVFGAAALLLLVMAFVWRVGFSRVCSRAVAGADAGQYDVENTEQRSDGQSDVENNRQIVVQNRKNAKPGNVSMKNVLLSSEVMILLFPVIVHGMLKDGVTAWVPTYINESFGVVAAFSILLTTILPIINLSGAYVAKFIYRKTGEKIILSVSFFFLTATAALILLYTIGQLNPLLSVLFLAVITASMMAVNTLTVNIFPLRFEKYGRVSSISGFLNAMAYLGTAISTYSIGVLVQNCGWKVTIMTWLGVTAFAGVLCAAAAGVKKRKNRVPQER